MLSMEPMVVYGAAMVARHRHLLAWALRLRVNSTGPLISVNATPQNSIGYLMELRGMCWVILVSVEMAPLDLS